MTDLSKLAASDTQRLILLAANSIGARQSDIPGLWNVPGHPELTTNQMLDLFGKMATNIPVQENDRG